MPGVEIKGCFTDIHSVNMHLNVWSGNKGGKMKVLEFFLTIQ